MLVSKKNVPLLWLKQDIQKKSCVALLMYREKHTGLNYSEFYFVLCCQNYDKF